MSAPNGDQQQGEEEEEQLPEGWTSRMDPRFNRRFYYHRATKTSTWEKPKFPTAATPPQQQQRLQQQQQQQQEESTTPETRRRQWSMKYPPETSNGAVAAAAASVGSTTPESAGGIISDDGIWVRVYSTTHQRHYFYNKATGKTSWLDPRLAAAVAEADSTDVRLLTPTHTQWH
jgi:hypothetical protein